MGATTCSFKYREPTADPNSAENVIDFGELGTSTNTRWAYTIIQDAPVFQQSVFHPAGVNGNVVVTSGRTAKRFAVVVFYAIEGELSDILESYNTDCEALSGKPFTFVDAVGRNWLRCRLDGMTHERVVGTDTGSFFIAHISFTCHSGATGTIPSP